MTFTSKTSFAALAAAAAFGVFALSGASNAAEMKACNDETFAMVMKAVEGAAGENKEMAMKEFEMAKEAMAAKDEKKCGELLGMAEKAAMKQ
jgi:uncharacterized low-complexity protein